jgi:hypothetical protein
MFTIRDSVEMWCESSDGAYLCEITTGNKKTLIGVIYRSPNSTAENNTKLLEMLNEVAKSFQSVVIMGDFNYPGLKWQNLEADAESNQLLEWSLTNGYSQHVNFPTRADNLLDLILTSEPDMVCTCGPEGCIGESDHLMVAATLQLESPPSSVEHTFLDFRRMKTKKLKSILRNTKWEEVFSGSIEEDWQVFVEIYDKAVMECIPKRKRIKRKHKRWMTRKVKKLVANKRLLWKRYDATRNPALWEEYKKSRTTTKSAIKKAKTEFEEKLAANIKEDSKSFFAYTREKQRTRTTVGPLARNDGTIVETDAEGANLLNDYFTSVFTEEDTTNLPTPPQFFTENDDEALTTVTFTIENIVKRMEGLKENKSCGPDNIHPKVLKECRKELGLPLKLLFTKSLGEGKPPSTWKTGTIVPLHKGGTKDSPANYRPVSLTSVVCKIFESIMKEEIVRHLEQHNLILQTQHGFLKGRSCLTNLLTFLEDVTRSIDKGIPVDVIYLDFAKAFDKVPHQRLKHKLEAHGIRGQVKEWIGDWLHQREQRVILNGASSRTSRVLSGVPQGSVLGPILFLVYINDIDLGLTCNIIKFADDTKIYMEMRDENSHATLQEDLKRLCEWSVQWQMLFNAKKCTVLHFGHNNAKGPYHMDGTMLTEHEEQRDLGIIIHSSLKPSQQCVAAAKKANKMLGMIKRNIECRSPFIVSRLYKQLIRPHLEYCIQAWRPWLQKDIQLLEAVQRRATKIITGFNDLPYEERLRRLHLLPLERRHERGDVIQTFKILKGMEKVDAGKFFSPHQSTHTTRGHDMRVAKNHCRLDSRKFFYSQRSVEPFNACPPSAMKANTILSFKKAISEKYDTMRLGLDGQ